VFAGIVAATSLALLPAAGSGQRPPRPNPIPSARIVLELDMGTRITFTQLESIRQYVEPLESEDGDGPLPSKRFGAPKPSTIALVRPASGDLSLAQWHAVVEAGSPAESFRDGVLTVYNAQGQPSAQWHLTNAWLSRLEVAPAAGGSLDQLEERVTLVADQVMRG
jgi:hypothetical protein